MKGPSVMKGYYKAPDLTKEVFDDEGWFHTGDVGYITPEDQLKITDRKKVIFKTSFGKYIAPQVLENKFKESAFIEHIMVIGANQKFAGALIVPNFEYLKSWCKVKGIEYTNNTEMINNPIIKKRLDEEVKDFNKSFADYERIKKYALIDYDWSVEGGQLSATLKVRRSHLTKEYVHLINQVYYNGDNIPEVE